MEVGRLHPDFKELARNVFSGALKDRGRSIRPEEETVRPFILMLLAACVPEDESPTTEATGTTMYRDAATEPDGSSRPPANVNPQPNNDPLRVTLAVEGTGSFDVGDPECEADQVTGAFEGLYAGEADIDDDGIYVVTMAEDDATFETASGCTLPTLSIGVVTGVVVRGELTAESRNCDPYCAAKARAYAETECDGDADEASCRASQETTYEASCGAACTSTTHRIVAETSLGASALSDLDLLGGTSLGTVEADLEFDHVEDEAGNDVPEGP